MKDFIRDFKNVKDKAPAKAPPPADTPSINKRKTVQTGHNAAWKAS